MTEHAEPDFIKAHTKEVSNLEKFPGGQTDTGPSSHCVFSRTVTVTWVRGVGSERQAY